MNRRVFLKRIVFTGAAVVAAPSVLTQPVKEPTYLGLRAQMEMSNTVQYNAFSLETLDDFIKYIAYKDIRNPRRQYILGDSMQAKRIAEACREYAFQIT